MIGGHTLAERTLAVFEERFGRPAILAVLAPGRVNLIGEHTDYNDGHVFPCAIDRYTAAAIAPRADRRVHLLSANLGEEYSYELGQLPPIRPTWVSYIGGVIEELREESLFSRGLDITVLGNVPLGAGLSSSASVEVAVATAIERLTGASIEDTRLVSACRRAENRWVGIQSGPMDQFAARACRSNHAGLLDCRHLVMAHYPLPASLLPLSIYTGFPRALAASEYNDRRNACAQAVETLSARFPGVRALRDVTPEMLDLADGQLDDVANRRVRHVVLEQERVRAFAGALETENIATLGRLLEEGHRSLSTLYEVSLPLIDEMVEWLREQPDILGTRLTGAGFGGSLVCLARRDSLDIEALTAGFLAQFGPRTPEPPLIWPLAPANGARYQATITP
jgi:galactokinase